MGAAGGEALRWHCAPAPPLRYAFRVICALILTAAAAAPGNGRPARLVVPDSVRARRAAQPPAALPLFSDARLLAALGPFDAQPGTWVEYAVLPKRGAASRIRVSVLSPLLPGGRYWLEAVTQSQDGPPVAVRLRVRGSPARADDVDRVLLFVGGQAPLELPLDDARAETPPQPQPAAPAPTVRSAGRQRLTVPAGNFDAEVLLVERARIFRAAAVPLFGLLRAEEPGRVVTLVGYGRTGAATVFPGEFEDQGNGKESVK